MNTATIALSIITAALAGLSGWLFTIDYPVPGWIALIAVLFIAVTMLAMIVSTGSSRRVANPNLN